jgi:hypothetical protein
LEIGDDGNPATAGKVIICEDFSEQVHTFAAECSPTHGLPEANGG